MLLHVYVTNLSHIDIMCLQGVASGKSHSTVAWLSLTSKRTKTLDKTYSPTYMYMYMHVPCTWSRCSCGRNLLVRRDCCDSRSDGDGGEGVQWTSGWFPLAFGSDGLSVDHWCCCYDHCTNTVGFTWWENLNETLARNMWPSWVVSSY